jgi:Tol biopolymer transport system component
MKAIYIKSKVFYTLCLLLLVALLACQPVELPMQVTATQNPPVTAIVTPALIDSTASPTAVPSSTLIPSATPLSTPVTPYSEEWLAFLKQGSEYWDDQTLFVATGDGNTVTQPRFFESHQGLPGVFLTWSPNGRFLQFDGGGQDVRLYLFDAMERTISGISPTPIYSLAYLGRSSWSPDSQHFVAALPVDLLQGGDEKGFDLFIYTVSSQEYRRLTTNPYSDTYPAWSPDGQWISFFRYVEDEKRCGPLFPGISSGCNQVELYVIRPDGSELTRLLEFAYIVHSNIGDFDLPHNTPSWSPDSQWLAILTGVEQPDITLVNIKNGETRMIAANPALDIYPTWSPDGSRLAFVSDREGNREIYLISPDGTGIVNLTNNPAYDSNPVWSPSGRHIAFLSNREGRLALYVMDAGGGNPTKIGENSVISQPVWFPLTDIDLEQFLETTNK